MNREEILKKAIEKAVEGGLKLSFNSTHIFRVSAEQFNIKRGNRLTVYHINELLFSHEFAKAFWGEGNVCPDCGGKNIEQDLVYEHTYYCDDCREHTYVLENWKHRIRQLASSTDRLEYISRFL
jgi:hypothetical protein